MKIGYLQLKPQFGRIKDNVKAAKSLMSKVTDATLVLPELFNTGYLFRNIDEIKELSESAVSGYTVTELKKVAKKQRLNLVFGIAEKKARQYFNTSVLITATGKVETYQKLHLFDREKLFFKPGTKVLKIYNLPETKIGMMVCFDWIFPEVTRVLALQGARVICHPSNLVLPYCQDAMKTRSIENRVFTITANRIGTEKRGSVSMTFTGKSQVVNPAGEVIASSGERSESLKVVEIDPAEAGDKKATPNNDIFEDRRVAFYKPLLRKTLKG